MFSCNDIILTKKNHPCGGNTWQVVRIGADYKIKCLTCGRIVMLTLDELKKRCKSVKQKAENAEG